LPVLSSAAGIGIVRPWAHDGACDADFDGVCASGTDGSDCGPID
jgi:hypothetical protein